MIRNLKSLGLALVTVLVLSAVVASVAAAAPKWTPVPEEYPVTVKGTQTTSHVIDLEAGTRPTECTTATFEGTIANKAQAEESSVTVTPTYSGCTTNILGNKDPATVTLNECHFVYTEEGTTTGTIKTEGWEALGGLHIFGCPVGHKVEIHVFSSASTHLENKPLCTYEIEEQITGGFLYYKLTEKNAEGAGTSGAIKGEISGITTAKSSGTLTNCGSAMQFGHIRGETKVEWFNSKGEMLRGKYED